jgi:hypothetical protein
VESRFLGPIELDGGPGGGAMERDIPFRGRLIPTRLEIDFPGRLSQQLIDDLDVVLEHLDVSDRYARDAVARQATRKGSAPHELYTTWSGGDASENADELARFVDALRPTRMVITPDGGRGNLDRIVFRYGLIGDDRELTVRLASVPTGPEVDHILRPAAHATIGKP